MTHADFRVLTTEERHRLALGAASVFERTALALPATTSAAGVAPTDQALAVLRTWIQAFSPGNPDALERRLGWDDLTLTDVARALSMPPVAIVEPDWLHVTDAIAAAARAAAVDRASAPLPERDLQPPAPTLPFFDLLVPVLRAGRELLAAAPGGDRVASRLGPEARAAFDRLLLRSASTLAELALFEELKTAKAAGESYDTFVQTRLEAGLLPTFLEYPVLARQLAVLAGRWSAGIVELVARLEADAAAMAATFGGDGDPGEVVAAEPGLSDPHHGGRRVAILQFASGLRVVYKPRSIALDRGFQDLLAWLHARGLEPPQRLLRLIDRDEYGWIEYVDEEPFADARDVALYYRRIGALVCITHVLRARDLHMENVVATRDGPVLIDLEMLLQPVARGLRTNAPRPAGQRTTDVDVDADAESCLTTGLVTLVESTAGQMFDIGGLRGTGEGASSVTTRVWHGIDTADLHYTDEKTFSTRVRNQVRLDGVLQSPERYADDLLGGFDAAYALLLAEREALLAPEGPIAAFADLPVRLLPRPTAQYASLAYLLARPQYQKDGCRWSAAMDALNRFVSQAHDQPEIWPVLVAERRALEALDIPHFTAMAGEVAVRSGTRLLIEHYYGQSGLDAVRARIQALSEADAAAQRERLRLALSESIHTRFATEPQHVEGTELDVTSPDFLIDHAIWIARELLVRAEIGADGLTWTRPGIAPPASVSRRHHLYDGSLGPALFLAATAVVSNDDRWRAAALDVVSGTAADLDAVLVEPDDIGVASGLGSIVYGLTIVGTLLGDETTLALATRAAAGLTPDRIAQDRGLDLVAGAAGAAVGLLALYKATRDARFLDLAVCCGDRLIATATPAPPGLAWRIADGRAFTGFAHGAAGIAYALGRLFDASGEKRFGRAATEGYRYVASRFIDGVANWPILGEPAEGTPAQGSTMTAWCHGAPGITLAISLGSADSVDPHLLDQLEPALKTTAAASPHKADHVCCGNVGRCEALFTTGRRLMRREAIEGGRRLARVVIARARAAGHFCLSANGYEYRMFDPGFFRGLSGIGYSLLRLASPSHLPSIAAFEAPPSGVRPGSRR